MKRRILMIDDDRIQFRLVQGLFKNFRGELFELEWAATYEEGLAKLLEGQHAACLLDYQLGPRNGLELIRTAMANGVRMPIVFLTAESSELVDIEAMHAGALDYLVKSEISSRTLERSLRYALKLSDTLQALRKLATHDQLTSLLNRREFDRILAEEKERSRRFGHPFALVLVDIDHFKRVNDTFGHEAGDFVLLELGKHLTCSIREEDIACRYGGEEFCLIMPDCPPENAHRRLEKIIGNFKLHPLEYGYISIGPVTISAGVASYPTHVSSPHDLLKAADSALYRAKSEGRDLLVTADAGLP